VVVALEQEQDQTEHQETMPTQQQVTHQAHWERTVRITAETAVVLEQVAVVLTVERQETQDLEIMAEQVVSQDQI
jgi:hypothetical protein